MSFIFVVGTSLVTSVAVTYANSCINYYYKNGRPDVKIIPDGTTSTIPLNAFIINVTCGGHDVVFVIGFNRLVRCKDYVLGNLISNKKTE